VATPKQSERRARIERAAYEVLKETGYKGASLLLIAQSAQVSNETLYRWYGNKQALFCSLVQTNANTARELLEDCLQKNTAPLEALAALGPILLNLVTGEAAITLNRAAGADVRDTATLGQAIASAGRETLAPLVENVMMAAIRLKLITAQSAALAMETYFHLLLGDLQIRRVIGVMEALTAKEVQRRSDRAFSQFLKLFANEKDHS
jgi:AcrR family transcriptional regulator